MRLLLDSNVILATLIDDPDLADPATKLMDDPEHDFAISSITIMELRAVLTKKEGLESARVETIIADLLTEVDVFLPDSGDLTHAVRLQKETLLYPMDAIILACADADDRTLVTFDAALLDHGATSPTDFPK